MTTLHQFIDFNINASKIFRYILLGLITLILVLSKVTQAASVNLNTWNSESFPTIPPFSNASWTIENNGSSATQNNNSQPTLLYSDFNALGSVVSGTVRVNSSTDNDYFGFAVGFLPGDSNNNNANYLLIDWKKETQTFNFGSPSDTPGSTANIGLAVSLVTGTPTADEFWGHTNFLSNQNGGLLELQRATNLGSTGWELNTEYEFIIDIDPNNLEIFVDGTKEIDITGNFSDGRFAFYNFSQGNVNFADFSVVPIPPAFWLFGSSLAGLLLLKRKRKRTQITI